MSTLNRRALVVAVSAMLMVVAVGTSSAFASPYTAHSKLIATSGQGEGSISLASTAKPGDFRLINIHANVIGTSPNTTFSVQRALDPTPTGTCDSLGAQEEIGTLTTSTGGAGAAHIVRESPAPSGFTFDVLFQLVGGGNTLVSECMTLTLK